MNGAMSGKALKQVSLGTYSTRLELMCLPNYLKHVFRLEKAYYYGKME